MWWVHRHTSHTHSHKEAFWLRRERNIFSFKITGTELAASKQGTFLTMAREATLHMNVSPRELQSMQIHTRPGYCRDTAARKIYYTRIFCH